MITVIIEMCLRYARTQTHNIIYTFSIVCNIHALLYTPTQIRHQEGLVENTRWMYGGIVFVNLHVVGSNNNNAVTEGEAGDWCGRTDTDSCADQVAEYEERTVYNLDWMAKAFDWAKRQRAKGVVVTWHANPGFDIQETYDVVESAIGVEDGSNGFSSSLEALWGHAKDFDGEVRRVQSIKQKN